MAGSAQDIFIGETHSSDLGPSHFDSIIAKAENIGYATVRRDLSIEFVSKAFYDIMGVPDGIDLVETNLIDSLDLIGFSESRKGASISPQDIATLVTQSQEAEEESRRGTIVTTQDGRKVRVNTWYNADSSFTCCVRDISKQTKQLNLLEIAIDAANAGTWSMCFETGKFEYSQSVLKRLTPSEVKRIEEHGLWSIIHRDDLVEITRQWQGILDGTAPFDMTYRVVTKKDGEMWQRSVGQIEHGAEGNRVGAIAFVTDITNDVNSRNDLLAAKEVSKSKSEFLARMSHEIRTPLNAIIGMSDSLKDENLSDEVMDVITDIEDAAEGLHKLLSRTLDHAKLISNKVELDLHEVTISEALEDVVKLWKPLCVKKSIKLTVQLDSKLPPKVYLDSFRLQQCLNNLLSNAVKFTEKGRINLVVKTASVKGKPSLIIAVSDTGIGMSEEETKIIFDPFMQADRKISRKFGGTGLGMSITQQLAELMGGEIHVRSKPNEGSTFALVLPLVDNAEDAKKIERNEPTPSTAQASKHNQPNETPSQNTQAAEAADESLRADIMDMPIMPSTALASPFEGLSVLCVEDNEVNQKVVKRLIGKHVSSLTFANNGREALDILTVLNVDIVLMDIHMPVMDGIETTIEIRESGEAWANVVIIALTADEDYQQMRICRNIGMDDTIAKPVRRDDILGAFDRVMGSLKENFGREVKLRA